MYYHRKKKSIIEKKVIFPNQWQIFSVFPANRKDDKFSVLTILPQPHLAPLVLAAINREAQFQNNIIAIIVATTH